MTIIRTAAIAYDEQERIANRSIAQLMVLLAAHRKAWDATPKTAWGYVGDLGYLNDALEEAGQFLKRDSALEFAAKE